MKLLFRPGWRMRCVDPPLGWIRVSGEPPVVEIRLQMTCFLTSQWASAVAIKELQLRVTAADREFVVPWSATADPDGAPLSEQLEYSVYGSEPRHVFVDFASDAPDLVRFQEVADQAVPIAVEGLCNDAIEFRPIAGIDMTVTHPLGHGPEWRRVQTGRELTQK